jgi:DNA-binding transcriptional regulator YdaS (Cro superfamily)
MRTAEVLSYFKTQTAAAEVLGISQASVSLWGEYPPPGRQYQIELLTKGALKAEKPVKKTPTKKAKA